MMIDLTQAVQDRHGVTRSDLTLRHSTRRAYTVLLGNQTQEPMRLKIKDFKGKTVTLVPKLGLYTVMDFTGKELPGLAIDLDLYAGEFKPPTPYTRLTVNFGEYVSIPNSAYVDTNNFPFADQLLAQGIAEPTDLTRSSGHCTYIKFYSLLLRFHDNASPR